jgi:hypothetical protein
MHMHVFTYVFVRFTDTGRVRGALDEQLLVPPNTTITGAAAPNDMRAPTRRPDYDTQTLFLATRGATDYNMR